MKSFKIARILSTIVSLIGLMVMVGWVLNIPVLTSILPQWVTMKFTTALSFLLSGITLYYVTKAVNKEREVAQIVLPITTLLVLLLMATLLISVFVGVRTGIEDLFVKETADAIKTTTPGRPSAGTMIDFILVAIAGILTMFNLPSLKKTLFVIGWLVSIVGGVGILGYILNIPLLYYTLEGWSTAMALHTATLFVLLGVGLVLSGRTENDIKLKYESKN